MSSQASVDLWLLWKCRDSFKRALGEQAEWLTGRLCPLENPEDGVEIAHPQRQDELYWTEMLGSVLTAALPPSNTTTGSFPTSGAQGRKGMKRNHPFWLFTPWNLSRLWSLCPCFPFFSSPPPVPKSIGVSTGAAAETHTGKTWPRKTFRVGRVRIHNPSADTQL